MAKPRVLWVDDDAGGLLRGLGRILSDSGLDLEIVPDVDTALHCLRKEPYDAYLLDLILPYRLGPSPLSPLGGLAIASEIRSLESKNPSRKRAPIVFLSVIRGEEIAEELRDLQALLVNKITLLDRGEIELLTSALKGQASTYNPSPQADG
jgi:CheY-like chemotaxis protein